MNEFYEDVEIVFTAKAVRLKDGNKVWAGELYNQLDYLIRSDKHMLVGTSKIDVKGKANAVTKED